MRARFLLSLMPLALVAGCADPPGKPKPLPLNYQEETQAIQVYRKYQPQIQAVDGVQEMYLTANNNPRRIVVVVRDEDAADRVKAQYGKRLDGLKMNFEVAKKIKPADGPIEQVKTVEQPTTWWGKIAWYLGMWKQQLLGQPQP